MNIAILVFDGVEELDFVGPWEVFQAAAAVNDNLSCKLLSLDAKAITAAKGLKVQVDDAINPDAKFDVILVPGGIGTRTIITDSRFIAHLGQMAKNASWVTSVCTGSLALAQSGLLENKACTTHHGAISLLQEMKKTGSVLSDQRFVVDGNCVTSAGVSAGIDMSLWLIGQIVSPAFARKVQHYIEYYPEPPYQED